MTLSHEPESVTLTTDQIEAALATGVRVGLLTHHNEQYMMVELEYGSVRITMLLREPVARAMVADLNHITGLMAAGREPGEPEPPIAEEPAMIQFPRPVRES